MPSFAADAVDQRRSRLAHLLVLQRQAVTYRDGQRPVIQLRAFGPRTSVADPLPGVVGAKARTRWTVRFPLHASTALRYSYLMSTQESNPQTYVWNWFALHAGQRLQLVNFWLVAVSFLATAFVQAMTGHLYLVAVGVSLAGTVSSLAFMRLDVRTQQLIQAAENALQKFEETLVAAGQDPSIQLVRISGSIRKSRLDSYRFVIRGLQLSMAVIFGLAFVYAIVAA